MDMPARLRFAAFALTFAAGVAAAAPAQAQYNQHLRHDAAKCRGDGPAIRISVTGVKSSQGTLRVQLYRATRADWLETGRWLNRIELPARAGTMSVCMPAGNTPSVEAKIMCRSSRWPNPLCATSRPCRS